MAIQFTAEEREHELRRLLYNSWHRGCKETDLLLGKFAKEYLTAMTDVELQQYAKLLDEDDWDIFNWITGKLPLPSGYTNSTVVQKLLNFHFADIS